MNAENKRMIMAFGLVLIVWLLMPLYYNWLGFSVEETDSKEDVVLEPVESLSLPCLQPTIGVLIIFQRPLLQKKN